MRCQIMKAQVGGGGRRCEKPAVEGQRACRRHLDREKEERANAIQTALGKPSKNPGYRDPELREFTRREPCCLAGHPLHNCETRPGRLKIECLHVDPKAHAGDHDNVYPGCPGLGDEAEGRGNRKRAERRYNVMFRDIAVQNTSKFMKTKDLTV